VWRVWKVRKVRKVQSYWVLVTIFEFDNSERETRNPFDYNLPLEVR
jgi:hypothetical protein